MCLPAPKAKGSVIIIMAAGRLLSISWELISDPQTGSRERAHWERKLKRPPPLSNTPPSARSTTPSNLSETIPTGDQVLRHMNLFASDHCIRVSRYSSQSLPIQSTKPSHLLLYGFKKQAYKASGAICAQLSCSHSLTSSPSLPSVVYTKYLPLYTLTNPHLLMTSGFKLQLHSFSVSFIWHVMHCYLSLL